MNLFVVFTCLFMAVSATSDQDLWIKFKNDHGKTYRSLREEKLRFNIFQEKLREMESHNAKYEKGEVSYFMRVNQFSDLTSEEFDSMLNNNVGVKPDFQAIPFEEVNVNVPDSINWVEKGAVLGVKNQGNCGSCWAFSVTGSIEGQNLIKYNKNISLSEQELVDCSLGYNNKACKGGYLTTTFEYLKVYGITSEESYPYKAVLGDCERKESIVQVKNYVSVGGNETSLQNAVGTVGPISVRTQSSYWQWYGGGIFDNVFCTGGNLNHAVLVVGYGNADGKDYWLIKNSWGTTWGEQGYIRLARNKGNLCGISAEAYYPVL